MKRIFKNYEFVNLLSFLIVYICSLTFLYVDGDDAITIAYHAFGRDREIQPSYYAYQGMIETLLSVLPANETLLRFFAIILSSISAVTFILVLLRLMGEYQNSRNKIPYMYFCILLPLIIPEFFFFGLVFITSTIAISLIIMSHLIIRKVFLSEVKNKKNILIRFVLSVILIGLGVSFRWDTGLYAIVILVDLVIISFKNKNADRSSDLKLIILWAIMSAGSIFFFIYLSGSTPRQVFEMILYARKGSLDISLISHVGTLVSFLTPSFFIFFAFGLYNIVIEKKYEILLLNLFILSLYLFLLHPSSTPKQFIYLFPGIVLIIYNGFDYVFNTLLFNKTKISKFRNIYLIFFLILILSPWFLGFQISSYKSTWGPGFDVRNLSEEEINKIKDSGSEENLSVFHDGNIKLFGSGNAIPTMEGPRPLWGYGSVLLGGDWRKLITKINEEYKEAINLSLQLKIPIILNPGDYIPVAWLRSQGFETKDPAPAVLRDLYPDDYFESLPFVKRKFINNQFEIVETCYFKKNHYVMDMSKIKQLIDDTGHERFVCILPSSSTIISLKIKFPENVKIINPFSAILSF